jgi:cysteine synthase A
MRINNILDSIGNTDHVKINKLFGDGVEVWMKLERSNPGGSIKDRIGLSMVLDAENKGVLKEDSVIIEPTSGNTGIGLAMVAAVKGYRLILVMPESMSVERRMLISTYGAELVLTPKEKGMKGAVDRATELVSEIKNAWMPQQFENEANTEAHRQFTAQEIIKDFPEGIDYLISGVGTGGHITGCAQVLKKEFPGLKVYAVEPDLSPVLSGGNPGPHPIQGIGAGFIPGILDREILDEIIQVTKEDAFSYAKRCAKEEGILVGISSGASLAAVSLKIEDIPSGSRILTFCYDTGERYLSTEDLF